MKRPLRYRTMGAVREGRGNPSPYSIETVRKLFVDFDVNGLHRRRTFSMTADESNGINRTNGVDDLLQMFRVAH